MALHSDITLDASKFSSDAGSEETKKFNEFIMDKMNSGPKWFQVGAAKYRDMSVKGQTVFPPPVVLDRGHPFSIPSREQGREIPCRVMRPKDGKEPVALFMYIHGGGWVLSSEKDVDGTLAHIADGANVVVVSVGYRLAPEHPFPQGPEDCDDAAKWLIDHAETVFGVQLQFIGGESAGGHLSMLTYLYLTRFRPDFRLSGLVLNYGVFDLSFLPQAQIFKKRDTLILDKELMEHYRAAFCPGMSLEQLRDPLVSPFYYDLSGLDLPPAMFACGTEDLLLDDTPRPKSTVGIIDPSVGAMLGFVNAVCVDAEERVWEPTVSESCGVREEEGDEQTAKGEDDAEAESTEAVVDFGGVEDEDRRKK
ncbi:MAG: hypothetical protein Q9188_002021 [Gyalolechia gomerana]